MIAIATAATAKVCATKCTAETTKPCKGYEFLAAADSNGDKCKHWYVDLKVDATASGQKCFV